MFLISLKAGGVGLNLTAADYVIHMDPWWNPAAEDQASDRAHRIGQTRPVTIYRLVTKGTIEEQVVALHHHKRDLAERLLEGADAPGAPRCRGAAGPPEKAPRLTRFGVRPREPEPVLAFPVRRHRPDFATNHGSAGERRCRHLNTAACAHLADGHLVEACGARRPPHRGSDGQGQQ